MKIRGERSASNTFFLNGEILTYKPIIYSRFLIFLQNIQICLRKHFTKPTSNKESFFMAPKITFDQAFKSRLLHLSCCCFHANICKMRNVWRFFDRKKHSTQKHLWPNRLPNTQLKSHPRGQEYGQMREQRDDRCLMRGFY